MTPPEPFVPSGPPAPSMPRPRIPPALASLVLFPGPASGASRPVAQSPALHLRSNPPLDQTQMIEMRAMLTRAGLDATRWRPLEGAFYFLPPTYPDTVPVPAVEATAPAVLPPNPALAGPVLGPRPVNRPQRDFAPGFRAAPAATLRHRPPIDPAASPPGRRIVAGGVQPAGRLSRIPPAPPVNQAVRQTGMPGLQPDQPASPDPAISGALNRAPPPAVSAARETAHGQPQPLTLDLDAMIDPEEYAALVRETAHGQPQPPTLDLAAMIDPEEYAALVRETAHGQPQPPTLDLDAMIDPEEYAALVRETAHGQPQPPTLDLAAMIDPEEYAALLRDCALSDRPPDPVVIHVDPRLLHDE